MTNELECRDVEAEAANFCGSESCKSLGTASTSISVIHIERKNLRGAISLKNV